jgi:thiol:disulfide interchange protein
MFGAFAVDFSRFQGAGHAGTGRGPFVTAFVFGGVAALLAGACVAPVLVSVLVLGTAMYQKGNAAGLLLPFLLGVGMALPWPFAGAGLSFLPRPGAWMDKVKYAFGVLILGMAAYYGWLGVEGLRLVPAVASAPAGGAAGIEAAHRLDAASGPEDWAKVAAEARRLGKPVFIDFWATWCKNCHAMDATTFLSPDVAARLGDFLVVKYQAEKPADPAVKAVLDRFEVIGLPTYVVLEPAQGPIGGGAD